MTGKERRQGGKGRETLPFGSLWEERSPGKGGQTHSNHRDIKTNEMSLSQGSRGLPGGRGHSTKRPDTALGRIKDWQEQWVGHWSEWEVRKRPAVHSSTEGRGEYTFK